MWLLLCRVVWTMWRSVMRTLVTMRQSLAAPAQWVISFHFVVSLPAMFCVHTLHKIMDCEDVYCCCKTWKDVGAEFWHDMQPSVQPSVSGVDSYGKSRAYVGQTDRQTDRQTDARTRCIMRPMERTYTYKYVYIYAFIFIKRHNAVANGHRL